MKFDNSNKKILQHIYRNQGITEGEILKKFPDCSMFLINCCKEMYLLAQDGENGFTIFEETPYKTTYKTKYYTTPKSNIIIDTGKKETAKDNFSRIIAIISLIITIIMNVINFLRY